MSAARIVLFVVVLLAAVIAPTEALAQVPPNPAQLAQRQATFAWEKRDAGPDLLNASFSFVDVLDEPLKQKLSSGLPTVVVMRAYVIPVGGTDPVALAARTCRIVYDLWDNVYSLKVSGPGGDRSLAAYNVDGVLRQCFEQRNLPVLDRSIVAAGKPYHLAVLVEVNPVNAQMIEQMRKWISRPAGSTGIGPGDALFGSFVALFVRQVATADRTLQFRTQPFTP
jgi:hypothetical protein